MTERNLAQELFPSHFEENQVTETTETDVKDVAESSEIPTEEKPETETQEDSVNWEDKYNELFAESETKDKRIKDNQRNFHKATNTNKKLLEKLVAEGTISEEAASEYLVQASTEDKDPITVIAEETKAELDKVKHIMEAKGEPVGEYWENFAMLSNLDPNVVNELTQLPAEQRLPYILDKGQEASELMSQLQEHNGNVLSLLNSRKGEKSIKEAEERGYAKAKEEYEAKLAEYVSGASKKPKLNSMANNQPAKSDDDESFSPFAKLGKFI